MPQSPKPIETESARHPYRPNPSSLPLCPHRLRNRWLYQLLLAEYELGSKLSRMRTFTLAAACVAWGASTAFAAYVGGRIDGQTDITGQDTLRFNIEDSIPNFLAGQPPLTIEKTLTHTNDLRENSSTVVSSAMLRAGMGDLHAYTAGSGTTTDLSFSGASGVAGAEAWFSDNFTILRSPSDPNASWVRLTVKISIDSLMQSLGYSSASLSASTIIYQGSGMTEKMTVNWSTSDVDYQPHGTAEATAWFDANASYRVISRLQISAAGGTDHSVDNPRLAGGAVMDVWNTSHTFLLPEDPGVELLTVSGADYTVVPEPMFMAPAACAFLIMGRRRRVERR